MASFYPNFRQDSPVHESHDADAAAISGLPRGRVTSSLPELLVSDSAVAGGSEILWLLVSRRETMWLLVTAARRGTVGNRVLMKLIDANYIGLLKL